MNSLNDLHDISAPGLPSKATLTIHEFETSYEQDFKRTVGRLRRFGVAEADAVDCVQDAFLHIWRNREILRDPDRIAAWINSTARNLAISNFRRYRRMCPLDLGQRESAGPAVNINLIDFHRALQGLKPRRRQIVEAHMSGHSAREIAELLGLSEATVYSELSRARREFRIQMGEGCQQPGPIGTGGKS